jgi:hypothetical protein
MVITLYHFGETSTGHLFHRSGQCTAGRFLIYLLTACVIHSLALIRALTYLSLRQGCRAVFQHPFSICQSNSFWYFSVIGRHRSRPHGRPQFFCLPSESINYRGHLLHAWSRHRSVFQCSRFLLTTFHSKWLDVEEWPKLCKCRNVATISNLGLVSSWN